VVLGYAGGCSSPQSSPALAPLSLGHGDTTSLPEGWSTLVLPGEKAGRNLILLQRPALAMPTRFKVIVIPGSGCTGFAPFAERYFAGLLHAQVMVLHKPGVDLYAGTDPHQCPKGFVAADSLSDWRDDARNALTVLAGNARSSSTDEHDLNLPTILVGISEGGELLPSIASAVPNLVGLVLLSSTGLDPREVGAMQADRLGEQRAWERLTEATDSQLPDTLVIEGRTLRYWRDLMKWRLEQPLIDATLPLLQVWGDADELVPPGAFVRFAKKAQARMTSFCSWRMPRANHRLWRSNGNDGIQQVWARLGEWGRQGKMPCDDTPLPTCSAESQRQSRCGPS
jgi:alpha-beta hydrolase superfamily lysophospholipase